MSLAWIALLAAGAAPPAEEPQAPQAPVLYFEDQFQAAHYLGSDRGNVVVLIYGDRNSVNPNRQLGEALHVHFHPSAQGLPPARATRAPARPIPDWPAGVPTPDVKVVPIACAGKVPGVVATFIRTQMKSKSPDLPVCLDFDNKMKEFYGMAGGVTNLAVLDVHGRVRYRGHGTLNPQQFADLTRFLEQLRTEARR